MIGIETETYIKEMTVDEMLTELSHMQKQMVQVSTKGYIRTNFVYKDFIFGYNDEVNVVNFDDKYDESKPVIDFDLNDIDTIEFEDITDEEKIVIYFDGNFIIELSIVS